MISASIRNLSAIGVWYVCTAILHIFIVFILRWRKSKSQKFFPFLNAQHKFTNKKQNKKKSFLKTENLLYATDIVTKQKTTVIKTESQRQGHNISQQNTRNLEKSVFVVPNSLLQMIKKNKTNYNGLWLYDLCVYTGETKYW